ncbi:MAG: Rieske 2Fe-2S domain-containing protein [Actinomycetaceae bacterium]|nr:Rieske 2Fe-2S domain-containing protein [Actinomycetaceae bacterium]
MTFQRACDIFAVEPASATCVKLKNTEGQEVKVAVVRDSDGTWHAIGDTCTHGDVPLSEGDIEGTLIECWGHGAQFDLNTGEPTLPATVPVPVYKLKLTGEDVLVDVDQTK